MKDTLSLQAHLLLQATKQIAPNPAMSHSMSGICTILWAIFASALFSSKFLEALPSRCNPFLYAKGASEPARILVQIPLMEFQNLHQGTRDQIGSQSDSS